MPILAQYGPSMLVDCANQIDLAKNLVKGWTKSFMFKGDPDADLKSAKISEYLFIRRASIAFPSGVDEAIACHS